MCDPVAGDSLLHIAARNGREAAALFLADNGANGNITNHKVRNGGKVYRAQ